MKIFDLPEERLKEQKKDLTKKTIQPNLLGFIR